MSNIQKITLPDGRKWGVGSFVMGNAAIIIPTDKLDGMTAQQIGDLVLVMRAHAASCLAFEVVHEWSYFKGGPDDHLVEIADILRPHLGSRDVSSAYQSITTELERRRRLDGVKPPRQRKGGYVYLAHADTGHYKIGYSVDPQNRIKHFDTQMPVKVEIVHTIQTDDMRRLEEELHGRFESQRVTGEWFDLGEDDVGFITSIGEMRYYTGAAT